MKDNKADMPKKSQNTVVTVAEHKSLFVLTNDTPISPISTCCEEFRENWQHYSDTVRYELDLVSKTSQ